MLKILLVVLGLFIILLIHLNKETIFVNKGIVSFKNLSRHIDNLERKLRQNNIKNVEKVKLATLKNRKIQILKKDYQIPLPIIYKGRINNFTLHAIDKDTKWLENILIEKNITVDNIYYAFYENEKTYIITN